MFNKASYLLKFIQGQAGESLNGPIPITLISVQGTTVQMKI